MSFANQSKVVLVQRDGISETRGLYGYRRYATESSTGPVYGNRESVDGRRPYAVPWWLGLSGHGEDCRFPSRGTIYSEPEYDRD